MNSPHEPMIVRDSGHWRWICSCGSKGIRLVYRESVERLAKTHVARYNKDVP